MIEIVPAIVPHSLTEIEDKLASVAGTARTVHIDACDGSFSPDISWPYKDGESEEFEEIVSEKAAFPFWEELDFEIRLMLKKPVSILEQWIRAGAARIIFHHESGADLNNIKSILGGRAELGVAINMETPVSAIASYIGEIDFVQFMSIDKIGHQGELFDDKVLEKIEAFKTQHPEVTVSVDGGINLDNAGRVAAAGANRLVVGSAIFEEGDARENYHDILKLVN